jgi:hypothetical protein
MLFSFYFGNIVGRAFYRVTNTLHLMFNYQGLRLGRVEEVKAIYITEPEAVLTIHIIHKQFAAPIHLPSGVK